MDYYDELGVGRDASEREIRQAYRVLVRLLHPDAQSGDDLRLAAERQLTRLNQVLAVLLNEDSRLAYDLSLEQGRKQRQLADPARAAAWTARRSPVADGLSNVARFAIRYWALTLIGVVIVGAAALSILLPGPSEPGADLQAARSQRATPAPVRGAARDPGHKQPVAMPAAGIQPRPFEVAGVRQAVVPEKETKTENAAPERTGAEAPAAQPSDYAEPPAEPSRALTQAPVATHEKAMSEQASAFAGNWLYTSEFRTPKDSDGYQAIYVELLLAEKDGVLSGNYRARYVVPDRAISPQVSFHLEGRINSDNEARIAWSAANGARGVAVLSLATAGVMDLHWWTTELAGQSGLSSGTAKLVRQRIP